MSGSLRAEASRIRIRADQIALFALSCLALLSRLYHLTFQPLWWDEGWSVYFAVARVPEMLRLTAVDIHPPLYYLLLHAWTWLFGPGEPAVRIFSMLVGLAAVPLIYLAGRRLVDKRLGLLAATLLVIAPLHIYYSQEVRMYGLVTLAGLATFYFALAWRTQEGQPAHVGASTWVGYVVSGAAALYTQYYAAFLLLALNVLVIGGWRRRPARRHAVSWLGAQAAVGALFIPWMWYAGPRLLTYVRFKVGVEQDLSFSPLSYLMRHIAAFQWGHAEGALTNWWWVGLLPLVLLAAGLWAQRSRRPWSGSGAVIAWPVGIVVVVLLCGFAVNLVLPFNPPRFERLLLLALPAYLLAISIVTTWLVPGEEVQHPGARRIGAIVAIAGWLVAVSLSLFFFYTVPRYPADDYRPVADQVAALSTPHDAIVCVHPWQAGYFYAYLPDQKTRPAIVLSPREVLPREKQLWAADPAHMAKDLDALLAAHGRVWLADHRSMGRVLEEQIETYLATHAYPALSTWHGENTVLSLFAAGTLSLQDNAPAGVTARLGDWLALDRAALAPGSLPAGSGVVPVGLDWRVLAPPSGDYRVGLRLVGAEGYVWAQRDANPLGGLGSFSDWPVGEARTDHQGLLVPAGTPPGDYVVTVRVYNEEDLSVLPVVFAGGGGGEVTLGSVHVTRPDVPPPVEALTYGDVMTLTNPLDVEFGPVRLVGSTLASSAVLLPGEAVDVVLFWQALADPGEDFYPWLQMVTAAGQPVIAFSEKPVANTYPTAWWKAGELVRDPHALYIPATAQPGEYHLAAGLVRAADGQFVDFRSEDVAVTLGSVVVGERKHDYSPPEPSQPQQGQMGERVAFLGYDLSDLPALPGDALQIVLYWHALQTPGHHYRTFVHLLDASGKIVAQADGVPGEARLPTLGWLPGEYIADPHTIPLPLDLPAGTYHLTVGLYEPVSGYRPGEPIMLDTPIVIDR